MTLYFVFINFSLSTFILFLNVSPPSIVWCTYVGNYYCPVIDECQWPAPMSIGPRGPGADRSEWCMVGDVVFAFLSGLSLQLQQWQFAAAWDSSNTFVARVAQSVFADPISQLSWSLEIAVWSSIAEGRRKIEPDQINWSLMKDTKYEHFTKKQSY